jgi:hypothetical protein
MYSSAITLTLAHRPMCRLRAQVVKSSNNLFEVVITDKMGGGGGDERVVAQLAETLRHNTAGPGPDTRCGP